MGVSLLGHLINGVSGVVLEFWSFAALQQLHSLGVIVLIGEMFSGVLLQPIYGSQTQQGCLPHPGPEGPQHLPTGPKM